MNKLPLSVFAALTLVSALYGINYSVLKIVVPEYIGAYGFIVLRVTVSVILFWCINLFVRESINWKADGWRFLLCGLTGIAINQLLFFKGISLTTAVNGSIIMTLTPIMILLWAAILIKEKVTWRKVFGIIIGMSGALLIALKSGGSTNAGNWEGDLLVFLNGTSYGCYLVLVKPLMSKYKTVTVVTWVFTMGLIFIIPVGWNEASQIVFSELPTEVWWSTTYTILGVTLVVYFLNAWTLKRVDASIVGFFIYLQPIFATLTAVFFFNEAFLWEHMIAIAFVFGGVWLVTQSGSNPVQTPADDHQ